MKTSKISVLFIFFALSAMLISSCDTEEDDDMEQGFDRREMLLNYSSNIILPAFEALQNSTQALDNAITVFADEPTASGLTTARTAWLSAYEVWQRSNAFNFGPAGEAGLRKGLIEEIGTWPVAVDKVEAAITAADHSLSGFDRDARGFLALEYLLFRAEENTVVDQFLNTAARKAHLKAISANLLAQVDELLTEWSVYEQEFIGNDGTDVGSSASQFYNEWVKSFESVKNFKVGLPAGKRPGQTQAEPQLVEAFYSATSLDQIKAHLQNIENIYYGGSTGGQGRSSLKTYLESVVGGAELVAQTEAQWANVTAALEAIPTDIPFQELVTAEDPSVDALHTALQKQTRFFKSDMSSLLGIAITFSSGDGD
ncbi:MAG: imelysin family protein [Mameliella sp.]|nr:imelysin family protein [Phaeodactylibacter sp.]